MSIAAMNWAWQQTLSPTPKLILMALADAANDQGVCWPSVSTVAVKCCVSKRTVRRVIQTLVDHGLMISRQRYRKDGSCSSNRYRLLLEGGDKLSPALDARNTSPGQRCQGPPDTGDRPGTTREAQKQSPQPQGAETDMAGTTSEERGGGMPSELEYPKALSVAEREEASKKLVGMPAGLAQQLLDELTASISANVIRASPLAYLRGLIARAREGTFTPEGALWIADRRQKRDAIDAATSSKVIRDCNHPPLAVDMENPSIKKLLALQRWAHEQKGE